MFDCNVFHYYIKKEKNLRGKIAYSSYNINTFRIKQNFKEIYAQLFKKNKVMKYHITIHNGQYILYKQMEKKKE